MAKSSIENYIDELRGFAKEGKEMDLYSLKKELMHLSESSKVFEDFEKESSYIDKDLLRQIGDLSSLIRIRKLASEINNKKEITQKLHSLHFNLNLLNNASITNGISSIKNVIDIFLHNGDTKIDNMINGLNDFKIKINEIKKLHSDLLPKSLDNKLEIENKYKRHIEQLHSMHQRQKGALISTVKLFLKLTKKHIRNLQKFK